MNTNKTSAFARSHQTSPRRSRLSVACLFLLGTLLALGVPLNTQAQTLYWDISGATAGAGGATPSGNWDATANWTTNSVGTSATQAWTSGRTAVFSAGTDATGAYTISLSGTQTASGITFEEGVATLSGGTLALTSGLISVNAAPTKAIIASVISGSSGLTKQNAGELVLAGANTFSGNLSFLAGTLTLNNNAAASTGAIVFNPSVGATAVLTSTNTAVTIANNITLGGTSLTPLEIDAATNSSITLNGVLSGGHSWAANGPGTLYLGGLIANNFAGAFVVRQGTVVVTADGALGSTANGSQVNAGATLALDGNVSYYTAESLTINGRGVNNLGALQGLSGLNYFYGPITFGSDTTIGAQAGSYLGLGASLFSSGTENLTITNSGTVIMSGLNNNYSNTLVSAGVLEVDYPANAGYGLVTVSTNATLSGGDGSAPGGIDLSGILAPSGTFSSGTQTWNGGGKYVWEILDATNAPVNDLLNISGSLNINATSGDKFTVVVASLDPNSYLPGPVGNFNNTLEYQWVIASATNTISTFIAAKFAVDATDFAIQNDMGGGSFRILASGTNLLMEFDPAPVIICPGSVVVDNTLNLCSASVAFAAIATNYADLSPVTIVYTNNGVPITSPNVFPVGTFTTVEATAKDSVGNTATCSFTVTVNDTQNPTPVTQNISVNLSGSTVSVAATDINNGSTDNCSITQYLISKDGGATYADSVSFGCGETGARPVKLKVVDASGLFATADATVTVNDVTAPTALAQNITVYLNNLGSVSVAASAINNSSSDNCTITYLQISKDGGATYGPTVSFGCGETGPQPVKLKAVDASGLYATADATVTVLDTNLPNVFSHYISVQLDPDGNYNLTPSDISAIAAGSTVVCGTITTTTVVPNTFTYCDVGPQPVTLTVTGSNGQSASAPATITVVTPTVRPSVVYVDDDYPNSCAAVNFPNDGNPGPYYVGFNAFKTISAAVTAVAVGGTVNVAPGTYPELVVVDRPMTLLGFQYDTDASLRLPDFSSDKADPSIESIITAAATDPSNKANDSFRIMADNVTINGFVVDGNNPALPTGGSVVLGGINIDSRRAIVSEDENGDLTNVNNATISYNIVQNYAERGIELSNPSNTSPATAGSLITGNYVRNFGLDGILLAFNAYADITGNTVVTPGYPAEAGIWVQDFTIGAGPSPYAVSPKIPGPSGVSITIADNDVTVGQDNYGGIWVNMVRAPGVTVRIDNNTVNAAAGVYGDDDATYGIYLSSLYNGATAELTGNNVGNSSVGQFARGIALWNVPTPSPITISGGSVGNSVKGVALYYYDAFFGLGSSGNLAASLSGVSISGCAVGVFVDATNAVSDTVLMQINNNILTGNSEAGIQATGGATVNAGTCDSPGGNDLSGYGFDGLAPWAIENLNPSGTPAVLAQLNWYGAVAGDNLPAVLFGNVVADQSGGLVVPDPVPPVSVQCPGNIPAPVTDLASFVALFGGVSATALSSISSSDVATLGSYGIYDETVTRTYTLTDECGQPADFIQTINVIDTENPTIVAPNNLTVAADTGNCSAIVNGIAPVSQGDNCGIQSVTWTAPGATLASGADDASGTVFPTGTTTVTYTITDTSGNSVPASFTVTVSDGQAPVIAGCPPSQFVLDPENDGQVATWTAPTASDNCAVTSFTSNHNPGDTFPVGITTVTYTAMDAASLTATCSFNVTVVSTIETFVDTNYTGLPNGTVVTWPDIGGSGTHYIGYDAFATIQGGVNAVSTGGKVNVASGTYVENVVVGRHMRIIGAQNIYFAPDTFINTASIGGNAITISADGLAGFGNAMEIQNIHCQGKTTDILNNNDYGITVTVPAYYLNLYNVYADNYRHAGLSFESATYAAGTPASINIWDCQFQACDMGINLGLGMNGVYIRSGLIKNNRYCGIATIGSDAVILDNITLEGIQFVDNGTGGLALSTYESDVFLQRFNGNALLTNLSFTTYAATALDIRGHGPLHSPVAAAGNVQIKNCTFTGQALDGNAYNKDLIKIRNYTDISTVSFSGVTLNTRDDAAATGLRFEDITGTANYTLAGVSFPNAGLGNGHGYDIYNSTVMNINATTGVSFAAAGNFTIEDRIIHKIDYSPLGLVTWVANNVYVTPNSFLAPVTTTPSVQRGIDAATAGDTVNVAAGTFTDALTIAKALNVRGANADIDVLNLRGAESAVSSPIAITGSGVTVNGFTVNGTTVGISVAGASASAVIINNKLTGNSEAGIKVTGGATANAGTCAAAGGNDLSGYGFDSAQPWAIENVSGTVQAYKNSYGAVTGNNLAALFFGSVLADQSGGLLVSPTLTSSTVQCPSDIPAPVTTLAGIVGLGGAVSATDPVTVSGSDSAVNGIHGIYDQTVTRTYTLTDACGQIATTVQTISVIDTTLPSIVAPSALPGVPADAGQCYATAVSLGTPVSGDNCGVTSVVNNAPAQFPVGLTVVTWTATDFSGLFVTATQNVTVVDAEAPTLSLTTPASEPADLTGHALVPVIVYSTSDNCGGTPSVVQTPTNGTSVAIGTTIITVVATDAHGNSTTNTTSLLVVAAQITGSLQLEGFDGSATAHSRSVVFVATTNWISGGVTNTTVLQSWTNTLSNVSGDTFAYTLPGVSPNANGLSAKTDWNLRKKLPIIWNGINTAGEVNFTGASLLPGGDIDPSHDNSIFYPDYSVLGNNWYTTNPVADINGDGQVNYYDYVIFYANWFTNGDPQ